MNSRRVFLSYSVFFVVLVIFVPLYGLVKLQAPTSQANTCGCHGKFNKVLAFSLFGDDLRFIDGALRNSELLSYAYPCWKMRVYYNSSVAKNVLSALKENGVEMINMRKSSLNPRMWRFLVARDKKVDVFCSRDVDSRLSLREFSAVSEWLESKTDVHLMIDHPGHLYRNNGKFPISAGMWCARSRPVRPIINKMIRHRDAGSHEFFSDQKLLQRWLAPKLGEELSVLRHRSFGCAEYPDDFDFPTPRIDLDHVGAVYINGMLRKNDAISLMEAIERGEECRSRKYRGRLTK